MFDALKEKIEALFIDKKEVEIIPFDDPIAHNIDWKPLEKGGSSFRTHELRLIGYNRIEVMATMNTKLLTSLFILAGIGMIGFYLYSNLFMRSNAEDDQPWMMLLMGALFFGGGAIALIKTFIKRIFDKEAGYFWKGNRNPQQLNEFAPGDRFVSLSHIHALQIIKEQVRTKNSSYPSYELNLVLKDLRRINVMDHSKLNKLREDADTLAAFLNVPIWDVVP